MYGPEEVLKGLQWPWGTDYVKYEKNPVLDETDLPEGGSRTGFRDSKMWPGQCPGRG
ncbi:hypothetical protein [uncultured Acetatifactor sp.]|uniref:hypothetical protein n=1 Tax=uncultured Acetatifactor sp. TaxID=1671927 RepID=UPI00272BD563|nr:hypothetical protein [uncultured Acetatifactor sp.]